MKRNPDPYFLGNRPGRRYCRLLILTRVRSSTSGTDHYVVSKRFRVILTPPAAKWSIKLIDKPNVRPYQHSQFPTREQTHKNKYIYGNLRRALESDMLAYPGGGLISSVRSEPDDRPVISVGFEHRSRAVGSWLVPGTTGYRNTHVPSLETGWTTNIYTSADHPAAAPIGIK